MKFILLMNVGILTFSYCKFRNFRGGFIFVKIKSLRNGEITLSFTDEGKSCHSRAFLHRRYVF